MRDYGHGKAHFLLEEKPRDEHSPGPGKTWPDVGNRKSGRLTWETWNASARERETGLLHRAGSGKSEDERGWRCVCVC